MIIDCHVHVSATTHPRGRVSPRLQRSLLFRALRWQLGVDADDPRLDEAMAARLTGALDDAPEVDAAVVLAFDAVYTRDGTPNHADTHFYVANDYVAELARRHPKVLFGASIHPYRRDAVAELERSVRAGAVLVKWLPIVQGFDPADARCFPLYDAMAHYGVPLLSHTGGERTLPRLDPSVADPRRLVPALERGVTVIAAHCGTRSWPGEPCFVDAFMRMARDYERCYGDTSGLGLLTRSYAYDRLLRDAVVREKLVHGSDWPLPPAPHPAHMPWSTGFQLMRERNALRRDVLIKQQLDLDDAYWHRVAGLLRLPQAAQLRVTA